MPKRAERRHHEARVKSKFKKVVKQQTRWMTDSPGRWEWTRDAAGNVVSRRFVLDRTLAVRRMQEIDRRGAQMAHHPRHQCKMCRLDPKCLKQRNELEVARKSPEISDDEEDE